MAQMYEVSFQTHYEDIIDSGKILVCAGNNDQAADMVAFLLDLPSSRTVFEVIRIKPNMYQLERAEISRKSRDRSMNKERGETARWLVHLTAGVRAASESHAMRRLATAITERACSKKAILDKYITDFDWSCERLDHKPRISATEQNAVYTEKRLFQGGAARPR